MASSPNTRPGPIVVKILVFLLTSTVPSVQVKRKHSALEKLAESDALTFHDVDEISHISFFDDQTSIWMLQRVHAIDDGEYLIHFQVLHEIII